MILDTAHRIFNAQGVESVAIRRIASEVGISHSNLIYHFKDKEEILVGLHERLLHFAQKLNQNYQEQKDPLLILVDSTRTGFRILFEYRFFLIDLHYIMKSYKKLRKIFLEVEIFRADMYRKTLDDGINQKYFRAEEFPGEYDGLIKRIRIFSDFWISSASIYDADSLQSSSDLYSKLFLEMLYPYLTAKGKKALLLHILE